MVAPSRRLTRCVLLVLVCMLLTSAVFPSALIAASHENPDESKEVFSGIALLRYYSEALDLVLQKDEAGVEYKLGKMPFTNVPSHLKEVTGDFASSGIELSCRVVSIDEHLDELRVLLSQSRIDDAAELADRIPEELSLSYGILGALERDVEVSSEGLKIASPDSGSSLSVAYNEVQDRLNRIEKMLNRYQNIFADLLLRLEALGEVNLLPTVVTLVVEPDVAFVGDEIEFYGVLSSAVEPMAERTIDILVNGTEYISVVTDVSGHYCGMMRLPYEYDPQVSLQALYYPVERDKGMYISSASQMVEMDVLFYQSWLELSVEEEAHPGLEFEVEGRFDYQGSPSSGERDIEVYLDDVMIGVEAVSDEFSVKVMMPPEVEVGKHTVSISVLPYERYAPVLISVPVRVVWVVPAVTLDIPSRAVVPGVIMVVGKISSDFGSVSDTKVEIKLGKSSVSVVSDEDGVFAAEIKMNVGLWLLGAQPLSVGVFPSQPWCSPVLVSEKIILLNAVTCGGMLIMLVALVLLMRRKFGADPNVRRLVDVVDVIPASSSSVHLNAASVPSVQLDDSPRGKILKCYLWSAKLIQSVTRVFIKPQQTLREFFCEVEPLLGPAAGFFRQLTSLAERMLYSKYQPTDGDVSCGEQLYQDIDREIKSEDL
ncbi:MAG: hypothetical protein J7L90_01190 [Dehalococcoidia bacterium]|nr:hypothetical protein [Dehalococcoidia bacterium]